jgi:hypothetical protein
MPIEISGKNYAFIVGSPRSGTSWLRRLLSSAPNVRSGPESYLFSNYVGPALREWRKEARQRQERSGDQRPLFGLSTYVSEAEFLPILKSYLYSLLNVMEPNLKQGELFLEKTPDHALFAQEIVDLLPSCKIIHIIRDPRDVVASILRTQGELGLFQRMEPGARGAARVWKTHVRGARAVSYLSKEGRFYEVRYEELLTSPKEVLKGAFEFLGLPFREPEIEHAIQVHDAENIRKGTSEDLVIKGEASKQFGTKVKLPKGFVGKASTGNWKEDLSTREKFWVWFELGEMMPEFGYRWDPPLAYRIAKAVIMASTRTKGALR